MADKPLDNQSDPLADSIREALAPKDINLGAIPEWKPRTEKQAPRPVEAPEPYDPTEVKIRTEKVALAEGRDPESIGQTLTPMPNLPDATAARATYGIVDVPDSTPEDRAAMRLSGELMADGTPIPRDSWTNIRNYMMAGGYDSVEGLANSRSWWMRSKRTFARAATPLVFFAAADFGVGMGLLDTFMWGMKKAKIAASPKKDRAEMEQLLLPNVKIGDQGYHNASTAALSIHRDRWWGGLQYGAGAVLGAAGAVVPGPGRQDVMDVARKLRSEGGRTWVQAMTEAPQILSVLGQNPGWHEIREMQWEANPNSSAGYLEAEEGESALEFSRRQDETRFKTEDYYAAMDRDGWRGDLLMGSIAVADVVPEVELDPFLWIGMGLQRVAPALRAAMGRVAPARHAKISSEVARATQSPEDAIDAVRAAQGNLARVEQRILGRAVTRDGPVKAPKAGDQLDLGLTELGQVPDVQISIESAKELVQARRAVANEQQWLSTFQDEGPKSDMFYKAPKRNSKFLPESHETREYIENYPAETKDGVFYQGWRKVTENAKRSTDDLAEEMTLRRHAEIERDADTVIYWDDLPKEHPMRQQRVLFGADDTEQAGDGINHMTRTGGQGIDDVTMTPTAVEYGIVQDQGVVPIRDWRAIDLANDATKAEKEWMGTLGGDDVLGLVDRTRRTREFPGGTPIEGRHYQGGTASGQFSLEFSTKRTLSRQLDVANRNLGHARREGNKVKIDLFKKEADNIRRYRDGLDAKTLNAEDKKFVDWLPKHNDGVMSTPERLNRWLGIAGDRVTRSMYPGGLHINALANTRLGQVFA
ncbi:MAG TPA: hypothetical protein VM537_12105, partial [Anaerolineae bacterium]|nr:hypothetical protein [Anaerolineae bacterium]